MINGAVINGAAINAGAAAVAVPGQAGDVRAWGQALGPLGVASGVARVPVAAVGRASGPLGVASGVATCRGVAGYSLPSVASELIRRGVVRGGAFESVGVELVPVAVRVHRARGSAVYAVRVWVDGAPAPWDGGVWLVDKRGYFLEWSYSDVGRWLVKSLSGTRVAVCLVVRDASQLPAQWTPDRLRALGDKVAALDPLAMIAAADRKAAAVADWGPGQRRVPVMAAAERMRGAARVAQVVQGMQAGGAWVPAGV